MAIYGCLLCIAHSSRLIRTETLVFWTRMVWCLEKWILLVCLVQMSVLFDVASMSQPEMAPNLPFLENRFSRFSITHTIQTAYLPIMPVLGRPQ